MDVLQSLRIELLHLLRRADEEIEARTDSDLATLQAAAHIATAMKQAAELTLVSLGAE